MSLEPCNPNIYENGIHVATMAGPSAALIEEYIETIRKTTGQAIDWNYAAGRAVVKTTGDHELVRKAILDNPDSRFDFLV